MKRNVRLGVVVAWVCLLLVGPASGTSHTWDNNGGSGDYSWHTAVNWNPDSTPNTSENVYINAYCSAGAPVLITSYAYGGLLSLGDNSGQAGYVRMTGGSLEIDGSEYIGKEGTGVFTQTAGTNSLTYYSTSDMHLGYGNDAAAGTYNMQGGDLYTNNLIVGDDGTGWFYHSGGTVNVGWNDRSRDLVIGNATTGHAGVGTYRLSGSGQLNIQHKNGNIVVGDESSYIGTGRFEWFRGGGISIATGGTGKMIVGTNGTLAMGYAFNADDLMNGVLVPLSGLNTAALEITNGATVTKNVSGTTCGVTYLRIGSATGAGTGNLSAGTVSTGQDEWIGDGGTGTLNHSGGNNTVTTHLYVGNGAGGSGTYNLGGTGSLSAPRLHVGANGGTGNFVQTGGTASLSAYLYIGSGAVRLKSGSFSVSINVVNDPGTGSLVLDGGALTVSGSGIDVDNLILGDESGMTGSYTLASGKTLTVTDHYLGNNGTGSFTQSGGTNNAVNLRFGAQATGVGSYLLTGGTLNVSGQVYDGPGAGTLQIDGGTFSPAGNVAVDNLKVGITAAGSHTQAGGAYTVAAMTLGNGTYSLAGGTLAAGSVANASGAGTLNIRGGTFVPSGSVDVDNLEIGNGAAGSHTQSGLTYTVGTLKIGEGTYRLSGGTLGVAAVANISGAGTLSLNGGVLNPTGDITVDTLIVGETANVSYTQTGHTNTVDTELRLGAGVAAAGTYVLSGGTLRTNGTITAGSGGATLVINGGSLEAGGDVTVNDLKVGDVTAGSYTQSAHAFVVANDLKLGNNGGGGTYRLTGGSLSVPGGTCCYVGYDGQAFFESDGPADLSVGHKLVIGYNAGSSGTYNLLQGDLAVGDEIRVGADSGAGRLYWANGRAGGATISTPALNFGAGGTMAMGYNFKMADLAAGSKTLFEKPVTVTGLDQATVEVTNGATAGHADGTVQVKTLRVGSAQGGGTYTLSGVGKLNVSAGGSVRVGADGGSGRLEWYRSTGLSTPDMTIGPAGTLAMGYSFGMEELANGTLFGGTLNGLDLGTLEVTGAGTATHDHSNPVSVGDLRVGTSAGSGNYVLENGAKLDTRVTYVGYDGTGRFDHYDGDHNIATDLYVGYRPGSQGEYVCWAVTSNLIGGFAVKCTTIGYQGTGIFTQHDGKHTVNGALTLGAMPGSHGTYIIEKGKVEAHTINIGPAGDGTFNIAGAGAEVVVKTGLFLGPGSVLEAVAGSRINMRGARFDNRNTDPLDLGGLGNLEMVFEGGASGVPTYEVASEDLGAVLEGFEHNFAMRSLRVGGGTSGNLLLVDLFENSLGGLEALYLDDIYVGPGSVLDMSTRGIHVYYRGTLTIEGTIINGEPQYVPDPATLALLLLGGLAVIRRRRK